MNAVRVTAFGDSSVLRLEEMPERDPDPGEVLVAVRTAGINPGEIPVREGRFGGEPPFGQHLDLSLFYMNLIYRASGGTDDLPPHDFAIADHLGVFGDDWFNAIVAAHTRSVPWTDAAVTFLENTREPDSAGPTTWHAQRVVCGLAIREELAPRVRPPK